MRILIFSMLLLSNVSCNADRNGRPAAASSEAAASRRVRPATLPSPANVTVRVDCTRYVLTWEPVDGAGGYAVYRKLDLPEQDWEKVEETEATRTNHVEDRPPQSPRRWFAVEVINPQGRRSHPKVGAARITPESVIDGSLSLRRKREGNHDVLTATWQEPKGKPAKYAIDIQQEELGGWKHMKSDETPKPFYTFTGSPQQRYRYRVQSRNECNDSAQWSNWSDPR